MIGSDISYAPVLQNIGGKVIVTSPSNKSTNAHNNVSRSGGMH